MNQINQDQINIGNESAIDLLVSQNKAKTELANNLQGLGVSANASTDTLEQLAYKVSTVSVDSNRQKVKTIAVNTENHVDFGDTVGGVGYFAIKNNFLFWRYTGGTRYILYKKLSTIQTNINHYDGNSVNFLSSGTTTRIDIGTAYDAYDTREYQTFKFNDDGTKLYAMTNNTIKRFTVSGYDSTTITLSDGITYTPKFNNSTITIKCFDINQDETKMLVVDSDGNVGIFDLTSASTTQDLAILTTESEAKSFFLNNTDGDIAITKYENDSVKIDLYSVSGDVLTQIGSTFTISTTISSNFGVGLTKYKVANNQYKIFLHLGGINSDIPGFVMIDGATKTITQIMSKYNINDSTSDTNPNSDGCFPINVFAIGTYYYVLAGMNLVVFDSNWNRVGVTINRINTNTKYMLRYTYIYDGDFYDIGQDSNRLYGMKHKAWFDKLIVYERTITRTLNGQTIQDSIPYYAQLTTEDLDNGIYNI